MRTRSATTQVAPAVSPAQELDDKRGTAGVSAVAVQPDPYRREARALWKQHDHADNFTHSSFLSSLVVNAQLTRRSYWQASL